MQTDLETHKIAHKSLIEVNIHSEGEQSSGYAQKHPQTWTILAIIVVTAT